MLNISEVKELIKLIDDSTISNFLYEQDGLKVEIKKSVGETVVSAPVITKSIQQQEATTKEVAVESVVAETPAKSIDENLHKITSPMVGTFYQSASPDADAFVKVGDKVTKDSVVCIVEAMKLFNEITAEVDGEIVEILVKDGELVEYGEPLFLVKA
ncbi:acetyl-CoA carboxylase biotin carboxyl carrier protein [Niallia sp. MER TA 168]|uniref:acetyl-CoA carboxylase biotin carboxyl carrier protein n=1 Tax=Niallia sp. MER TA 168 TaxID=2939568 RepID=UPI00203D69C2|nr:acetyl-CoA carboxylase biotin carboxyl carrier protein [Niallia sp. MER TA 168]MCM3364355.1 acetyl-CoA carboxylase biotin carboxyl carrier protein [Niallia sp. MER TA 168]